MKAHPFNIVRKNKKECIYVGKYVTKRVLLAIVTVFIVCGITFFAMNAIPGGPFDGEKALSPEVKEALEKRFNLDKPVGEQFVLYMKNLAHGDFGVSAKTGRDIKTTIFESFKVSAKLGGMAILTALVLGLIFGSLAALTRNHLLFHPVYVAAKLRVRIVAASGILCDSEMGSCVESGQSELSSSGNCPGSLPHGVYHTFDQEQYAGCSGTGLCPYSQSKGCVPAENYF